MIIIHEGVDGSGKSFNAKRFAEDDKAEYVHNPVDWESEDPYQGWIDFMEKYSNSEKTIHVDRSFLSNKPYRLWEGTPEDFTEEQLNTLCSYPFIVYYYESDTEYKDATARGEDKLRVEEDYKEIKSHYRKMLRDLHQKYKKEIFMFNWHLDSSPRPVNEYDQLLIKTILGVTRIN